MNMGQCTAVRRFGEGLFLATLVTVLMPEASNAQSTKTTFVRLPDGTRIAYETRGEGTPALIFVHGWSCDRSYWKGQLEPFSRQFKVVALDLGGHGESDVTRKSWTMATFGADTAAVVEQLGLKRVILIGHSMGGDVIIEAARRLKGRVAGLIWVDTYRQLGTSRTAEQVAAFLAPFRANFVDATRTFVRRMFPSGADPALVERVAADMSAAPPAVGIAALESAFSYDREVPSMLQQLNLPVIALNAGYRPTDTASLERYGVQVMIMPHIGHFLMMEDADRFNSLLQTAILKIGK